VGGRGRRKAEGYRLPLYPSILREKNCREGKRSTVSEAIMGKRREANRKHNGICYKKEGVKRWGRSLRRGGERSLRWARFNSNSGGRNLHNKEQLRDQDDWGLVRDQAKRTTFRRGLAHYMEGKSAENNAFRLSEGEDTEEKELTGRN